MSILPPPAPDVQPPTPIVCVTARPERHHPWCVQNDCYCNVWCAHGRMGWGDCIACGYDETLTYHALAARPVAR